MTRGFPFVLLLLSGPLVAQPAPEDCIKRGDVTVTHEGRIYRLASDECRQQFLSDPERFAQLYDALRELEEGGKKIEAPAEDASLVPS